MGQSSLPDIAFLSSQVAVFCDGDFWHGRDWPKRKEMLARGNNSRYWVAKIQRNIDRDKTVVQTLTKLGWLTLRVWEGDFRNRTWSERTLARRRRGGHPRLGMQVVRNLPLAAQGRRRLRGSIPLPGSIVCLDSPCAASGRKHGSTPRIRTCKQPAKTHSRGLRENMGPSLTGSPVMRAVPLAAFPSSFLQPMVINGRHKRSLERPPPSYLASQSIREPLPRYPADVLLPPIPSPPS